VWQQRASLQHRNFASAFLAALEVRLRRAAFPTGLSCCSRGEYVHAIDWNESTPGRRPSGARLYHRGSRFGEPERRKLDRNLVARILFLAEALERRTRAKGQHGGVLKRAGLDVLRALLRGFYSYRDGTCFPSYEAIAEAAGCCRATVAAKLRVLEQLGIIETVRRKVVASFTSLAQRVRFDVAVQTSNSYTFNFALVDRPAHGDLALPLLARNLMAPLGSEAESKFQTATSLEIKTNLPPDLAAALVGLGSLVEAADRTA
jgi:CRP-like cAMP-binding protein